MRNQPILEVDDAITRGILNTKPPCSKSVRKYILSMVTLVERTITAELAEKFGLLFYGCSDGAVHYVAIFETYRACNE